MQNMDDTNVQFSTKIEDVEKPVRLSLHLIVQRHLPEAADKWNHKQIVEELNKISHLRLDREKLHEIDGLELLGNSVTNVYLQMNRIERIENLECLTNLSFLTLANNRITRIQNLTSLQKLLFLDLSDNLIDSVDVGEIPQSVIILNIKGNPCTTHDGYRESVVARLPKLKQLDLADVTRDERLGAGHSVSSDDDEEEEEEEEGAKEDNNTKQENFQSMAAGIMIRSQKRLEEGLKLHKKHTSEMDDLRMTYNI